jgi:hypothetical protein
VVGSGLKMRASLAESRWFWRERREPRGAGRGRNVRRRFHSDGLAWAPHRQLTCSALCATAGLCQTNGAAAAFLFSFVFLLLWRYYGEEDQSKGAAKWLDEATVNLI